MAIAGIKLKRPEIARILHRRGFLIYTGSDRLEYRRVPGMPDVSVFALDRAKIGVEGLEVVGGD